MSKATTPYEAHLELQVAKLERRLYEANALPNSVTDYPKVTVTALDMQNIRLIPFVDAMTYYDERFNGYAVEVESRKTFNNIRPNFRQFVSESVFRNASEVDVYNIMYELQRVALNALAREITSKPVYYYDDE